MIVVVMVMAVMVMVMAVMVEGKVERYIKLLIFKSKILDLQLIF